MQAVLDFQTGQNGFERATNWVSENSRSRRNSIASRGMIIGPEIVQKLVVELRVSGRPALLRSRFDLNEAQNKQVKLW